MRFNLALAVSLSIILIGVASWSRFRTTNYIQPELIAIEQLGANSDDYETILHDFLEPETVGMASTSDSQFSNTDLIGQKLVLDYISLAANGQATEASLISLANQYVESIPALNKAEVLSTLNIKTVPNTQINFQKYADALTKIYGEYVENINKVQMAGSNLENLNPVFYSATINLSNTYTTTALKLKDLSVPIVLLSPHLKLLNNYLSSASAMEAVSKTEQDPVASFAGLITLKENTDKEEVLLNEIGQILISNGI